MHLVLLKLSILSVCSSLARPQLPARKLARPLRRRPLRSTTLDFSG
eukprot:CAMPEP_0119286246 /NCGR_PEP_ID=MMETSP1329-20130426/33534_1 /TAXON_ID=114041 /ORGANISM="Genus nov. species nov., Strain RCC1024" /LENGTH=45 /DNA_ID= /DNA_START= /DNA_END= /DNA_ORIENTATION=